jgi:hypothetical protein
MHASSLNRLKTELFHYVKKIKRLKVYVLLLSPKFPEVDSSFQHYHNLT